MQRTTENLRRAIREYWTQPEPRTLNAPEVTAAALTLAATGHETLVIEVLNQNTNSPVIAGALRAALAESTRNHTIPTLVR